MFFPEIGEVGVLFDLDRVSRVEKTTFLSNRPARRGHAGSLDLGEETDIVKNSLVKSFVCRRAVPPFARKPHENGQPHLEPFRKIES